MQANVNQSINHDVMRKSKKLFMLLPFLVLAACSGGNSPEGVAEKFNKALYTADFDGAKALCTNDSKQAVDFVAAFASQNVDQMKKADIKYEVTNVIIAEDENSADVEGVVLGSIDLQKNEVKDSVDSKMHLVKVDGKWLVEYRLK